MEDKKQLRKRAKQIRAALDMSAISRELCAMLRQKDFYKCARHVIIFHPKPGEVDVLELLEDDKIFYLPRVSGTMLEICRFCKNDELKCSKFGVHEPCIDAIDTDNIDLIIVPALAADAHGYRWLRSYRLSRMTSK